MIPWPMPHAATIRPVNHRHPIRRRPNPPLKTKHRTKVLKRSSARRGNICADFEIHGGLLALQPIAQPVTVEVESDESWVSDREVDIVTRCVELDEWYHLGVLGRRVVG